MELFHENGHLTSEGLKALTEGRLDELARLEAAEHLSFCDECLVRYTALLEDAPLAAPKAPLAPGVWQRILPPHLAHRHKPLCHGSRSGGVRTHHLGHGRVSEYGHAARGKARPAARAEGIHHRHLAHE